MKKKPKKVIQFSLLSTSKEGSERTKEKDNEQE
jgi:hypothetical protein